MTYPNGGYSSVTPAKTYVYDAATVDSATMMYPKSRLAEAYTGSPSSKTTDLGFSYNNRGEVAAVYQSSPHSGGYYHIAATYYAPQGLLEKLTPNMGASIPNWTYLPEGEGRVNTISASAGQNPVTGTSYNGFSEVMGITFGSADSDAFTYDPNTGRMTQYKASVGGSSMTGTPGWNANWTLGTLGIVDGLNSKDTQSCSYAYDNLARLTTANCGSTIWSQSFTYDAFGNINKSGTQSFMPTYSETTNRYTFIGSVTPTYDNNGNLTKDGFYTYTWDGEGNLATLNGNAETYDALDRRVEQYNGSAYTEIVYGPAGNKFALMSGQAVTKVFAPLSGGATAVYTSSGLSYYRHPDWLGSSRVASTPTQTLYYDGAYAPFGENYAETGTTDRNFTGQNQDLTPGATAPLYDFLYREYQPTQGRWVSPDPAGVSAVNPTNPQSWNRYAYVDNDPLASFDPYGLYMDCGGDFCTPFSYGVSMGCVINVVYDWIAGDDGVWYQMPSFNLVCSAGTPVIGPSDGAGSAAGNGQKQPPCASPNFLQQAGIPLQRKLAQALNAPVGFGAGGSAGVGVKFGVAFSLSRQVVVSPTGEAGFLTTYTVPSPFLNATTTGGVGGYGGLQFSVYQNANTLADLEGPSLNTGVGGGDGLGGGVDFSLGLTSGSVSATVTVGAGLGGVSKGAQLTTSTVNLFCGS